MEILIKNGTVISSDKVKQLDIYIKDGIIKDLFDPQYSLDITPESIHVINAENKLIFPGFIDAHTHFDMPFMGTASVDDFETGSRAALYGGVTTVIDYIIPKQNQKLQDAFHIWEKKAENKSYIDYAFHMVIVPPIESVLKEFSILKRLGISSVKSFMAYKDSLMLSDEELKKLFEKAKECGVLVCIHAEDGAQIALNTDKLLKEGKSEPVFHSQSRPAQLEALAIEKILKITKELDTSVYFVHVSTKDGFDLINKARLLGQKVFIETCPQYLLLTEEKYNSDDFEGAKYIMSPPLRSEKDRYSLEQAVMNGQIDVIATDHCPFNFAIEKQMGKDNFTKIPNGIPAVEARLSLMYQQFIVENKQSLIDFVKINSTNPANIFALNHKGDISINKDADIVIWDPVGKNTISVNNLHENVDYSPFEGFTVNGKLEMVIIRGNIVLENDKILVDKTFGKYVKSDL